MTNEEIIHLIQRAYELPGTKPKKGVHIKFTSEGVECCATGILFYQAHPDCRADKDPGELRLQIRTWIVDNLHVSFWWVRGFECGFDGTFCMFNQYQYNSGYSLGRQVNQLIFH